MEPVRITWTSAKWRKHCGRNGVIYLMVRLWTLVQVTLDDGINFQGVCRCNRYPGSNRGKSRRDEEVYVVCSLNHTAEWQRLLIWHPNGYSPWAGRQRSPVNGAGNRLSTKFNLLSPSRSTVLGFRGPPLIFLTSKEWLGPLGTSRFRFAPSWFYVCRLMRNRMIMGRFPRICRICRRRDIQAGTVMTWAGGAEFGNKPTNRCGGGVGVFCAWKHFYGKDCAF